MNVKNEHHDPYCKRQNSFSESTQTEFYIPRANLDAAQSAPHMVELPIQRVGCALPTLESRPHKPQPDGQDFTHVKNAPPRAPEKTGPIFRKNRPRSRPDEILSFWEFFSEIFVPFQKLFLMGDNNDVRVLTKEHEAVCHVLEAVAMGKVI